ncbi:MAG: hypothetical protein OES25_06385 [Acidobacteriota bacterium]|nr:hypothetical protein [Acidobacteriota bacterium]
MIKKHSLWLLCLGLLLADAPSVIAQSEPDDGVPVAATELRYRITATAARVNRRPMGPTRRRVQGVPAEPIDSFVWNGEGSTPVEGRMTIDVLPMRNTGVIDVEWTDTHGDWHLRVVRFLHPDIHSSGIRLGSSANWTDTVLNEAISHNVYLHGDTGAGQPVLPTVFTYLAAWGPAKVTLNGELFANPFELPAPLWGAHIMVTEGVRREDGSVRTLTNEIYNPSRATEGAVEPADIEAHMTFHDEIFPRTENIPPFFSFFYHVIFEDVQIEITQSEPVDRPDILIRPIIGNRDLPLWDLGVSR